MHCPHERHVLEAWSTYADPDELVTVFLCEGTSSLCIDVVLHRKWPFTVCCVNRQGKSTGCELLKVWKVFRVEPADGPPQTHKVVSGEQLTQDHSFQKSLIIHGLFSVDNRFCACGLVIPPWLWVCFLISKLSKKFLNFFAPSPVPGCSAGLLGLCTQQIQRDETERNPTKIFSISATRWN